MKKPALILEDCLKQCIREWDNNTLMQYYRQYYEVYSFDSEPFGIPQGLMHDAVVAVKVEIRKRGLPEPVRKHYM